MSDPITITIRRVTKSGNKSTFGSRWAYVKDRNEWKALVYAALVKVQGSTKLKDKPNHRVKLHIISYRRALCDRINFAHGCKAILDSLVQNNYLRDDNEKWLDDTYEQVQESKDQRTTIIIYNP